MVFSIELKRIAKPFCGGFLLRYPGILRPDAAAQYLCGHYLFSKGFGANCNALNERNQFSKIKFFFRFSWFFPGRGHGMCLNY